MGHGEYAVRPNSVGQTAVFARDNAHLYARAGQRLEACPPRGARRRYLRSCLSLSAIHEAGMSARGIFMCR